MCGSGDEKDVHHINSKNKSSSLIYLIFNPSPLKKEFAEFFLI